MNIHYKEFKIFFNKPFSWNPNELLSIQLPINGNTSLLFKWFGYDDSMGEGNLSCYVNWGYKIAAATSSTRITYGYHPNRCQ
mgnify:CR=1 FL=1